MPTTLARLTQLEASVRKCENRPGFEAYADVCESTRVAIWSTFLDRIRGRKMSDELLLEAIRLSVRAWQCTLGHYSFNAIDRVSDLFLVFRCAPSNPDGSVATRMILTWFWRELRRESTAIQDINFGVDELLSLNLDAIHAIEKIDSKHDDLVPLRMIHSVLQKRIPKTDVVERSLEILRQISKGENNFPGGRSPTWKTEIWESLRSSSQFERPNYPITFVNKELFYSQKSLEVNKGSVLRVDGSKEGAMERRIERPRAGGDSLRWPRVDYRLLSSLDHSCIAYELQDVDGFKIALPICSAPSQDELSAMLDEMGSLPDNIQYTNKNLLNGIESQDVVVLEELDAC